jgi:flagellar biosynthesis/type III secretory pathway protein FliH
VSGVVDPDVTLKQSELDRRLAESYQNGWKAGRNQALNEVIQLVTTQMWNSTNETIGTLNANTTAQVADYNAMIGALRV